MLASLRDRRRPPRRLLAPRKLRAGDRGGARAVADRLADAYYAVVAIPLAVVRPRLSAVWLAPPRDLGPAERGHRRRKRLGQRARADRVHGRVRRHRAGGTHGRSHRRDARARAIGPHDGSHAHQPEAQFQLTVPGEVQRAAPRAPGAPRSKV